MKIVYGGDSLIDRPVLEVIRERYNKISFAERKVADFILENPHETVDSTVAELASKSGVSDSTVIRMCHHLGYKGYYQFKLLLAKDLGRDKDEKEATDVQNEPNAMLKLMQKYANSLVEIGNNNNDEVMKKCVNIIKSCNQVHVIAIGNTMPLALYMGFRLGRLGVKSTYNVLPEYFLNHINLADKEDIVIAISQSGSSKQLIQGVELAKEKGLKVIGITGYKDSPLAELADYVLISNGHRESFSYYKNYAHLKETAVIDALLEMLTNWELIKSKGADKPEVIMSDSKY